ncbi:MAG: hypothetical protein LBK53_08020 [Heliobacteriaceae bacterium]|nr:hypothetical protein [Heliobacteriaceae bacterium]
MTPPISTQLYSINIFSAEQAYNKTNSQLYPADGIGETIRECGNAIKDGVWTGEGCNGFSKGLYPDTTAVNHICGGISKYSNAYNENGVPPESKFYLIA